MGTAVAFGLVKAGMAASTAAAIGTATTVVTTGISLLSGIKGAYEAESAGLYQQRAYEAQAEGVKAQSYAEGLKDTEQDNLRRERLLNALAAQNLRAGAGGVTGGTVAALQLKSMEDYRRDELQADVANESILDGFRRQQQSLKLQAGSAKTAAKSARKQGLMDIGMGLASTGFSPGAPSPAKGLTRGGANTASGGSYVTGPGLAGVASPIHLSGRR